VKGGSETAPYSIDDNLWGRSSEGRWIEDLAAAPEDDVFQLVTRPEEAPDEAQTVTIAFERGLPVALDGERLGLVELIERLTTAGSRHGVGIVDHIEDRIVGLKVRDIYEVPAAAILLRAHAELEQLVGTIHQNQFKVALDQKWAYLVYAGLWWEPLREDLDAYMRAANEQVTGEIAVRLYKGSVSVVTRSSPNAVYDAQLATFAQSGGLFSQTASPGFIDLWTLQSRMDEKLPFADISWADDVPGIRVREAVIEARRWAIVEYALGARREDWCIDGHAGFVLSGAIEYEFRDGGPPLSLDEGEAFALSTGRAHRGANRANGPTQLFVIDDPAEPPA
jgi:hypothetical protein